jgi:hypothetical protein
MEDPVTTEGGHELEPKFSKLWNRWYCQACWQWLTYEHDKWEHDEP